MCAQVSNAAGAVQRTFCAHGNQGLSCRGDLTRVCDQEDPGPGTALWPRSIWYQAAIDWAKQQGHPKVNLDPGVITITATTGQEVGFPYSPVGIHVPSGIHLKGARDALLGPTIINVGLETPLAALVLVADLTAVPVLSDVSVSYLDLVGTTDASYSLGQKCPAYADTLTSILQLDTQPPVLGTGPWNFITGNRADTAGLRVLQSHDSTAAPVNVHHMKVTHLAMGIAYGWNTSNIPEDPNCETRPGLTLTVNPSLQADGGCPANTDMRMLRRSALATECRPASCAASPPPNTPQCPAPAVYPSTPYEASAASEDDAGNPLLYPYCITKGPGDALPNYCNVHPFEFHGNPNARSQIHNNSICDVRVGINVLGGNIDVTKNVVIRHPTNVANHFALSSDGHMPYTQNTTYSENYVSGFTLGFLTDGNQYIVVDDCAFRQLTGYDKKEFATVQNFLDLSQFMLDNSQQRNFQTDPQRGFIDHVYIRDNRFYKNVLGLSMYRVNWGFIGFNTIDGQGAADPAAYGIQLSNTLNSWVYGNTLRNTNYAIEIGGLPQYQSLLGSCYNGIHTYCSGPGCPVWASYPNAFSGSGVQTLALADGGTSSTACNVAYHRGYCGDPATPPLPGDAGTVCFAN